MEDSKVMGKDVHPDNDSTIDNEEIEEVLNSVPPEQRKVIERMMISTIQMRSVSSPESVVMNQITSEHITKYLDGAEQEMKNSYAEKFQNKVFGLLTIVIVMIFFVIIIVLLKEKPDVMEKVLYTVGGVITGAFGGYGLGKKQKDE